MIVDKKKLLNRVIENDISYSSIKEIEEICDILVKEMYHCFESGDSIQYENHPLFKVKKTIGKLNENSPKTPRNDRIMVSVKIPLDTKQGVSNKSNFKNI